MIKKFGMIANALLATALPAISAGLLWEPIVLTQNASQGEKLLAFSEWQAGVFKPPIVSTQFVAAVSAKWIEGLVPLFVVERESGDWELRRLPGRGVENSSEPLCFVLPRVEETAATRVAGRWDCVATNAQGTKHYVSWELAVNGERVAGRLDQNTDYRFAFVTGGTFRSNELSFTVEYINDRYTVRGVINERTIQGHWQQIEGENGGLFQARRPEERVPMASATNAVPLFEWRNRTSNARRYAPAAPTDGADWQRSDQPLGRVWPVSPASIPGRAR